MGGCVFMWWVCIYGVGDIRDVYIWVSAGGTLVRACLVGEHMGMRIYGGGGGSVLAIQRLVCAGLL